MTIQFKTGNGTTTRDRWIVKNSDGVIVAKFYHEPNAELLIAIAVVRSVSIT